VFVKQLGSFPIGEKNDQKFQFNHGYSHLDMSGYGKNSLKRRQKIKIPGGEMSENKRAVVTAEQIIDCLLAEYEYWKNADSDVSIGAIGAISNVIAFATVENHRAEWHPVKEQNK
jgi:hypothetical protein